MVLISVGLISVAVIAEKWLLTGPMLLFLMVCCHFGLQGPFIAANLAETSIPLTNGKGAFSDSLAEWVATAVSPSPTPRVPDVAAAVRPSLECAHAPTARPRNPTPLTPSPSLFLFFFFFFAAIAILWPHVLQVLHFNKQIPRVMQNRVNRKWEKFVMSTVAGKTLGIVGFGHIGQCAAKLMKQAFGMKVIALRNNPNKPSANADEVLGPDRKLEVFARSDFVVCALPGTDGTTNYCGAPEFAAMKETGEFRGCVAGHFFVSGTGPHPKSLARNGAGCLQSDWQRRLGDRERWLARVGQPFSVTSARADRRPPCPRLGIRTACRRPRPPQASSSRSAGGWQSTRRL